MSVIPSPDGSGSLAGRLTRRLSVTFAAMLAVATAAFTLVGWFDRNVEAEMAAGQFRIADWVIEEMVGEVLPTVLPLLVATLLVTTVTVRHSLKPLRRLSRTAAEIVPGSGAIRLDEAGVPDEILPLVRAVNTALARLDAAVDQQRRLAENAAHELRTPLAVLRARVDGLAPSPECEELAADLDRMERAIGQILMLARLEGIEMATIRPIDLTVAVRDAAARLAPVAIDRGIALAVLAPDAPVPVDGDPDQIGQALANLVDNALAASSEGDEVEITVSPDARVTVADRGIGLEPGTETQVFERFWRSAASRRPGSGLGLAIVAEIMKQHGGSASAAARPGGGAQFALAFPLRAAQLPATRSTA